MQHDDLYQENEIEQVTQQPFRRFTQGIFYSAGSNFDLAINGEGFFTIENAAGERLYTRAGAFSNNKDGFITDLNDRHLIGFPAGANGKLSGNLDSLKIDKHNIKPCATNEIMVELNLPANAIPPMEPFFHKVAKHTPNLLSYNEKSTISIFDSLGAQHELKIYYVKAPTYNEWNVYLTINDINVTPYPADVPDGGSPSNPSFYPEQTLAKPFTVKFNDEGQFIEHNSAAPTGHYGNDTVVNQIAMADLLMGENLPILEYGDLTINDELINIDATIDTQSTNSPSSSSITLARAINDKSQYHRCVAKVNENVIKFDIFGAGWVTLSGNSFVINGIQITGTLDNCNAEKIASLIGNQVPNVIADVEDGNLILTATDGRNIHLFADGNLDNGWSMSYLNSQNALRQYTFDLTNSKGASAVFRGNITLELKDSQTGKILIGGTDPLVSGFNSGVLKGIYQNSSDIIQIMSFNPDNGADLLNFSVDLSNCTSYASNFEEYTKTHNGYYSARFHSVDVDPEGLIKARYVNGQSKLLGQIALADIPDVRYLEQREANAWATNQNTGEAILGAPATSVLGLISSGTLEDIRHQGYSAFPFNIPKQLAMMTNQFQQYKHHSRGTKDEDESPKITYKC